MLALCGFSSPCHCHTHRDVFTAKSPESSARVRRWGPRLSGAQARHRQPSRGAAQCSDDRTRAEDRHVTEEPAVSFPGVFLVALRHLSVSLKESSGSSRASWSAGREDPLPPIPQGAAYSDRFCHIFKNLIYYYFLCLIRTPNISWESLAAPPPTRGC